MKKQLFCRNAGANITLGRYTIANDRTFGSIHDEPDAASDAANFDIVLLIFQHIYDKIIAGVLLPGIDFPCSFTPNLTAKWSKKPRTDQATVSHGMSLKPNLSPLEPSRSDLIQEKNL